MTKFQINSTTGGEMNYLLNITTTNSHKIFVGHFEVQNEVYLTRTENCVVANHIVIKLKQ